MAGGVSGRTVDQVSIGGSGEDYIDDTSTHATDLDYQNTDGTPAGYVYHKGFKYWRIITAMSDCVLATLTTHSDYPDPDWDTADTLSKDQQLFGHFTEVDLTSGTAKLTRG